MEKHAKKLEASCLKLDFFKGRNVNNQILISNINEYNEYNFDI